MAPAKGGVIARPSKSLILLLPDRMSEEDELPEEPEGFGKYLTRLTQQKADENEASHQIKTEFLLQLDGLVQIDLGEY